MEARETVSLRQRILCGIAAVVCRHARWIVPAAVILAVLSVLYALHSLTFITDRNALVSPEADYNKRFLAYCEAFGDQELMMVVVAPAPGPVDNPQYDPDPPDAATLEAMKRAGAEFASRLREEPELFPWVLERVDPDEFGGTRMLYLPTADLERIAAQVEAGRPVIEAASKEPGFPALLTGMRDGIEQGEVSDGMNEETLRAQSEGMTRFLRSLRESLEAPAGSPPPGGMFAFESSDPELDEDGYILGWGGRLLLVPVLPMRDSGALDQVERPLARAREIAAELRPKYPELAIGLSGRPVIYSDEMAASGRDMGWATGFAVLAVGLLFVLSFRSFSRPLLAVASLLLALAWTIGATTLVIGHLNIFAMVFGVVLVGLGIDFGIHLLSHYRAGMARGLSVRATLAETYAEIGSGTVLGALTTAAALTTAVFTDFLGLAELGLICGMGIALCLLAMLVVFPAMLVLRDRKWLDQGEECVQRAAISEAVREAEGGMHPASGRGTRLAALAIALLCAAGGAFAAWRFSEGWQPFDYNLLELNDPSSAGVQWEDLMIRHDQRASFAVSVRGSLSDIEELRPRYEALREQGLVSRVEGIAPADEDARRAQLRRIFRALPETFAEPGPPSTARELRSAARKLESALGQLALQNEAAGEAFAPAKEEVHRIFELCSASPEPADARLAEIEPDFFGGLRRRLATLRADADPPGVTPDTLPDALRRRYVGKTPAGEARYALYVYPARNIWERENLKEFNHAVLAIDPEATGVTVQIEKSSERIVEGFGASVLYAFLAILLFLAIDLRRPLAVLTALMPLLCALLLLATVMSLTSLRFNFANFFAVPILIGTAVDAGVYLVHSQRHGDPVRTLRQTRRACALCGATTLLGFGALMFASHRGIVSLGVLLSLGCVLGGVATWFVVPAVLGWFHERGKRL